MARPETVKPQGSQTKDYTEERINMENRYEADFEK